MSSVVLFQAVDKFELVSVGGGGGGVGGFSVAGEAEADGFSIIPPDLLRLRLRVPRLRWLFIFR
jgi:hypothetical protein